MLRIWHKLSFVHISVLGLNLDQIKYFSIKFKSKAKIEYVNDDSIFGLDLPQKGRFGPKFINDKW